MKNLVHEMIDKCSVCVCVCVCACVRACVRASVRVCVCAKIVVHESEILPTCI